MSLGKEDHAGPTPDGVEDEADEIGPRVVLGEYTWADFFSEYDEHAQRVEANLTATNGAYRLGWDASVDPSEELGFFPDEATSVVETAYDVAVDLDAMTYDTFDPEETPVVQGEWTWHHFVRDCVDPEWDGIALPEEFEASEWLTFPEEQVEPALSFGEDAAEKLQDVIDEHTLNLNPEIPEDEFFQSVDGTTTITNRYDLEKAVTYEKKQHFREVERYWVNKPYAFVIIFHSEKENETKYYLIEPYQTSIEEDLFTFLTDKLRTSIKYSEDVVIEGGVDDRRSVLERETMALLERYDIYEETGTDQEESQDQEQEGRFSGLLQNTSVGLTGRLNALFGDTAEASGDGIEGIAARPEPALLEENASTLTEYQVDKLLYRLRRDFLGYERIDGIKHDINVEDISCDGYNSPVFVYHSSYEQIITNVFHGEERLDDFVVKLAQRSGKGISKRQPQVDATLPDGSRAQLTLGREVSDHGTNYTIRQFNDVPFTPIDLINWRTFSLEEMAFLWVCIENHKSLIFAGGTASGKTTSLNAVSLFIPSNSKIVSIEDTREVELPQRNWIASVTRPSFSEDSKGDVDEFDLLEAALRQRPDYIVMGEIRGEEGRTLFQVMSTGHTTYTTFHADSVGEVLKRFTTDPINVSKTMFTALDLVSIQTSTRVRGKKVRRNKSLTEINHYDTENDEINVQDVYQWQAETDEFLRLGDSNTLDEILFDRGWDRERLDKELFMREVVLAYLIENGLNEYREVAATLQAFITDPEATFSLIATDQLEESLEDLREMESVLIDVDPEKEALVPRPDPDEEMLELTDEILTEAEAELFPEYREKEGRPIADALVETATDDEITAEPGSGADLEETLMADEDSPSEEDDQAGTGEETPGMTTQNQGQELETETEPPAESGAHSAQPVDADPFDTGGTHRGEERQEMRGTGSAGEGTSVADQSPESDVAPDRFETKAGGAFSIEDLVSGTEADPDDPSKQTGSEDDDQPPETDAANDAENRETGTDDAVNPSEQASDPFETTQDRDTSEKGWGEVWGENSDNEETGEHLRSESARSDHSIWNETASEEQDEPAKADQWDQEGTSTTGPASSEGDDLNESRHESDEEPASDGTSWTSDHGSIWDDVDTFDHQGDSDEHSDEPSSDDGA